MAINLEGKFSPMDTEKKDEFGAPKIETDMTADEAKTASAKSAMDEAEAARESLESAVGEKKSPEDTKAEIAKILNSLK